MEHLPRTLVRSRKSAMTMVAAFARISKRHAPIQQRHKAATTPSFPTFQLLNITSFPDGVSRTRDGGKGLGNSIKQGALHECVKTVDRHESGSTKAFDCTGVARTQPLLPGLQRSECIYRKRQNNDGVAIHRHDYLNRVVFGVGDGVVLKRRWL